MIHHLVSHGGHRQGDKPDLKSGGVALARDSDFDYSALLPGAVPEWLKGLIANQDFVGSSPTCAYQDEKTA